MTEFVDSLLALIPEWGALSLALITFLSCLAVPIPASLAMMAGGAFAAAGDLDPLAISLGALGGALLGDQSGYLVGRFGGSLITRHRRRRDPADVVQKGGGRSAALLARARGLLDRHGAIGIFLSRWLLAPLGPWMNLTAGAVGFSWPRFTLWAGLGEIVWVGLYVGLGMVFVESFPLVAEFLGDLSMALVLLMAALAIAWWLWRHGRGHEDRGKT